MVNWTDPIIHWNQLPGTEVKRLLDTWGKDEAFIAKYDKKHGYTASPVSPVKVPAKVVVKSATKTEATTPVKAVKKATTVAPKKTSTRQKHTGPDGAIKFVEHRELYVGFFGGKVVVTKRTEEACREYLTREYGVEPVGSWEYVTV
jgi:hypothetical protein